MTSGRPQRAGNDVDGAFLACWQPWPHSYSSPRKTRPRPTDPHKNKYWLPLSCNVLHRPVPIYFHTLSLVPSLGSIVFSVNSLDHSPLPAKFLLAQVCAGMGLQIGLALLVCACVCVCVCVCVCLCVCVCVYVYVYYLMLVFGGCIAQLLLALPCKLCRWLCTCDTASLPMTPQVSVCAYLKWMYT